MNLKNSISICIVALGALTWPGTIRADASPGADEKIVTEVAVRVGQITTATLHDYVRGYGTIETAPATAEQPAAGAQLAAPSAGVVTKVNVVEGQQVQKGDVLVELNSQAAEAEVARQKKLYEQQNTSLRSLQEAEAQLALLQVTAPLSGTVARVNVQPGQAVDLTTVVAEVMDLNRLAVSAEIPAAEAGSLKAGIPVELLTRQPVATKLLFVSPTVDQKNDTVLIRALLPQDSGLRPGQFVALRVVTAVHTNCLVVPAESVVTDESGQSVIALVANDEATQTLVQTGLRENGLVEVAAPAIKAGDNVVTTGAYGLPEKTKIRVLGSADETSTAAPAAQ